MAAIDCPATSPCAPEHGIDVPENAATDRWHETSLTPRNFTRVFSALLTRALIAISSYRGRNYGISCVPPIGGAGRRPTPSKRSIPTDRFGVATNTKSRGVAAATAPNSGKILLRNRPFRVANHSRGQGNGMAHYTDKTLSKHIRMLPEQWERIERAAQGSALTANQLVMDLAIEALERRDWPTTRAEIHVARTSLFTAQTIARDLISNGRESEVEEIREFISTIVPDVPDREPAPSDRAGPAPR